MNFAKFGWVISTGLLGLMVRAGIQPEVEKVGFINVQSVYDMSQVMDKSRRELSDLRTSWQEMGDFVGQYPAFKIDQLTRFRDLWTKVGRTPPEETELTKLKTDSQLATKHYDDLRQKPSPTPADLAEMDDLGKRALDDTQAVKQWQGDLNNKFTALSADKSAKAEAMVMAGIAQVAKAKGLTLVFSEKAAAYGSPDITQDVQKAVDKNNK